MQRSSVDSERYCHIPRTYSYVRMIKHIPRTYSYVRMIEPRRLVSICVSAFLSALTDTPSAENKLRARALARARPVQIHPISPSKFDGICAEGACSRRERGANTPRRSRAQPTNPPAPAADHPNFLTRITLHADLLVFTTPS